ncbi:phosphoglycerate mutase [Hyphomonas polymorpha PS728]|uniref:Phosphoglycerate mutase n=1 Tax=Hyphomonas polymorpha PS728 TaxID=1280954 RepID=A0A062V9J3_9PROT|nr:histidine phosphatase family protein [Hyphomonas polymorpha]KCZ96773.1 phosphoglycerate mutase [Hyphomonas polymorpha PS728]
MIFLIRHGEAAASWGDHPDPGLSDLGKGQAEAASEILTKLGATSAITSPMQRCRETAQPFEARTGLTARVVPDVSEISTPDGIEDRVSWLRELMAGTWTQAGPDLAAWRHKMSETVSGLPEGTAVFSHFVAINALVGALESDDRVTVFRPGHCSVTRLERRGGVLRVAEYGSESATRVL